MGWLRCYTWSHQLLPGVEAPHLSTDNDHLLVLLENLKRGNGLQGWRGDVGTLTHQQQFTDGPVLLCVCVCVCMSVRRKRMGTMKGIIICEGAREKRPLRPTDEN